MGKLRDIIYFCGQGWGITTGLVLTVYFTLHAYSGEHSLQQLQALNQKESVLQTLKNKVITDREILERRITALKANGLDPDMLEEQVRINLGFAHPDEVVVFIN